MKLEHVITIDILQFFKTGKFDFIELGQDKQWILNNFPDPDGLSPEEALKNRKHDIWLYGDFEFHFSQGALQMVYADYWHCLQGGEHIKLIHWLTDRPVTLHQLMLALNREHIDFHVATLTNVKIVRIDLPASIAELSFSDTSPDGRYTDSNDWQWCALTWRQGR